jgi:hypothetical protein
MLIVTLAENLNTCNFRICTKRAVNISIAYLICTIDFSTLRRLMASDCSRSTLLSYEFPLPLYVPGHRTGSSVSSWAEQWNSLIYWKPDQIASMFMRYWDSTVTSSDKIGLIVSHAVISYTITVLQGQIRERLASEESHVRRIFDSGISFAHRVATSNDAGQLPPSDLHSSIHLGDNSVFGEPDYLLLNPASLNLRGVLEAKSPWNMGPLKSTMLFLV